MKKASFESSLTNLESLVEKMNSESLSLEEALSAFEQGVKLAQQCEKDLKNAEKKVECLVNYDSATLNTFDSDS